jgi:diguanylate cyclase (GGDEF)-like protein
MRFARVLVAALSLFTLSPAPAGPALASSAGGDAMEAIVLQAFERPDEALSALDMLKPAPSDSLAARRWNLWRGLVEARDGRDAAAQATSRWLTDFARQHNDGMAEADAALVLATLYDTQGNVDLAAEQAQTAWEHYERLCGRQLAAPRADCDHRPRFNALLVMANRANSQGLDAEQRRYLQTAVDLARGAQDLYRQARAETLLARAAATAGEMDAANKLMAQALRNARLNGAPALLAQVRIGEARLLRMRGDEAGARRTLAEAQRIAQAADMPRLEAQVLTSLTDLLVKSGQPQEALEAVERALPVVRRHHDQRSERVLLHNGSLARLALHQLPQARKDFEQMFLLWRSDGERLQSAVLSEFSDALAGAGDHKGALELYHRERKLAADLMQRSRESAVHELQIRYDREAQQRHIELLERDSALKSAQIENRSLLQRVWTLVAATLTVAAAFAVLLYMRVRETQRQLEQSHARLRVQSERDALTGLANRRHFQDVMRQCQAQQAFDGALLLVDIDHFKHINDSHGHAAGDEVLVEVAKRIQEAVRGDDLVVRWGGEEFLVYAPGLEGDALRTYAERLLRSVGATPVDCKGQPLRVTASIGHAQFPLPPNGLAVGWERALNLVDMALYTAKSVGRNRAVGIVSADAADMLALRALEDDFERAWTGGRVVLHITEGP